MTRKQRRFAMIAGGVGLLAAAVLLMLFAMRDYVVFFNSPTDVTEKHLGPGTRIRLGGLVVAGSVSRGDVVCFDVTDGNRTIPVSFNGILPDLFSEGKGVIAEGTLDGSGGFKADNVLAKHDENYMPKEVADALKKQGHWKDGSAAGRSATAPDGAVTNANLPDAAATNQSRRTIVFLNSPTGAVHAAPCTRIRLRGLIVAGSLSRGDGVAVHFDVTDGKRTIPVTFQGLLPDLVREGTGVVAEGTLDGSGAFNAYDLRASLDENDMPKGGSDGSGNAAAQ